MNVLCFIIILMSAIMSPDSLQTGYDRYVQTRSPEKLYLHIDRTYFCAGETLWFNGWLKNASEQMVFSESNYIYVELLDQKGTVVQRVKIKRDRESFPGHIDLGEGLQGGQYTLRAYTLWQLNGDCEYMFNQTITIYDKSKKKSRDDGKEDIDLSFYPEGGRHFVGTKSVIGFKAIDSKGRSVDWKGTLVDGSGEVIADVSVRHDGMGTVMYLPAPGKTYFLRSEDGRSYSLPLPASDGATVNVSSSPSKHVMTVDGVPGGSYGLFVRDASNLRLISTLTLGDAPVSVVVASKLLRPGINHALLIDEYGNIASERLFYSGDISGKASCCTLSAGAPSNRQIDCALTLTGAGTDPGSAPALDGVCSVSIVRGFFGNYPQDDGIVSYMNLSSELRGKVNDPAHYFDDCQPASRRFADLDLLLMIQGWNYYDSAAPVKYPKEYTQSVSGSIRRVIGSKKAPSNFIFYVFIPKIKFSSFVDVAQASEFIVDSLDFDEGTGVLIKADRIGTGSDYIPQWDGDVFAPDFRYVQAPGAGVRHRVDGADSLFAPPSGNEVLDAAVVTADSSSPFLNMSNGRTVSQSELEIYSGRTLIEYLDITVPTFKYDGENMFNTNTLAGGFGQATQVSEGQQESLSSSVGAEEGPTKGNVVLAVDGVDQPWPVFEDVRMEDVAAININKHADAFYNSTGGVVAIVLKSGAVVSRQSGTEPSLLYITPLGWQQPRQFYSPLYEQQGSLAARGNTVYWNPRVEIKGGKAEFSFLECTEGDSYYARIEGVTSAGIPFTRIVTF